MPFKPTSQDEQGGVQLKVNNSYFELFDKYVDSFAVSFACNFKYIYSALLFRNYIISLTVRLGCLWMT